MAKALKLCTAFEQYEDGTSDTDEYSDGSKEVSSDSEDFLNPAEVVAVNLEVKEMCEDSETPQFSQWESEIREKHCSNNACLTDTGVSHNGATLQKIRLKRKRTPVTKPTEDVGGMHLEELKTRREQIASMHSSLSPSVCKDKLGRHECIFCHKLFRDRYHLARHQSVHSGQRVPDCSDCKKPLDSCGCAPFLDHYANFKQHECELCHKLFRDKYHLRRHELVHTKEKPFQCSLCDKAYSRKDKLTQHYVMHGH